MAITKFQCSYCLHMQAVPSNLGGRKILCPLCGDPIVIPKSDAGIKFKKQILAESIDKFKLEDWDKAFAKALLAGKEVQGKTLYKCIAETIKISRKSEMSLAEYLVNKNVITDDLRDKIRSEIRGSVATTKTKFIECPNCFANVDANDRACKFCGQRLGDAASVAICPNCKFEQEPGVARCRRCMADMKTGLMLNQKQERCPACGSPLTGKMQKCQHCKYDFKKEKQSAKRGKVEADSRRKKLIIIGSIAALVAVMVIGRICYYPVRTILRTVTVGHARATLDEKLRVFNIAIKDNHPDDIEQMLDPVLNMPVTADVRTFMIAGKKIDSEMRNVRKIDIASVEINESEGTATVKVNICADVRPIRKASDDEFGGIARGVFGNRKEDFSPEWKWVRKNKVWFYSNPLPETELDKL